MPGYSDLSDSAISPNTAEEYYYYKVRSLRKTGSEDGMHSLGLEVRNASARSGLVLVVLEVTGHRLFSASTFPPRTNSPARNVNKLFLPAAASAVRACCRRRPPTISLPSRYQRSGSSTTSDLTCTIPCDDVCCRIAIHSMLEDNLGSQRHKSYSLIRDFC